MHRTAFERSRWLGATFLALIIAGTHTAPALAQGNKETRPAPKNLRIVSSEIALSREQAELKLELSNGHKLTLSALSGDSRGQLESSTNGSPDNLNQTLTIGVQRGDELDRSWRELLNKAMDTTTDELGNLLTGWQAPAEGSRLDRALEDALQGLPVAADAPAQAVPPTPSAPAAPQFGDSLDKLHSEIDRLQDELQNQREQAVEHA